MRYFTFFVLSLVQSRKPIRLCTGSTSQCGLTTFKCPVATCGQRLPYWWAGRGGPGDAGSGVSTEDMLVLTGGEGGSPEQLPREDPQEEPRRSSGSWRNSM